MPRLAPEKRGAGLQLPRHDNLPPLPVPDQTRYGPRTPRKPGAVGIVHTDEGGGTVSTCLACGWLAWHETRLAAERDGTSHRCRSGDRCLTCGPPHRLGDNSCPHLPAKPSKKPKEATADVL